MTPMRLANNAGFSSVLTECAQPGWASDCNAGTWFSPSEETRLNQTADLLNGKLSAAASARSFSFANPISESYHPNRTGHSSGYLPLVSGLLA
jgi:hypothetical protein